MSCKIFYMGMSATSANYIRRDNYRICGKWHGKCWFDDGIFGLAAGFQISIAMFSY